MVHHNHVAADVVTDESTTGRQLFLDNPDRDADEAVDDDGSVNPPARRGCDDADREIGPTSTTRPFEHLANLGDDDDSGDADEADVPDDRESNDCGDDVPRPPDVHVLLLLPLTSLTPNHNQGITP